MASMHRRIVSTIVLIEMISRELEPLAIFSAFLKIEMWEVPSMGIVRHSVYPCPNYHIKADMGPVAIGAHFGGAIMCMISNIFHARS